MIFSKLHQSIIGTFCILALCFSCGGDSNSSPKANVAKINNTAKKTAVPTPPAKVLVGGKDMATKSGEEFCMEVKVSNFVDIVSIQYSTNWDTKALRYKSVKSFNIKDLNNDSFGRPDAEPGSLRFLWMSMDLKPVSLFNDATIYQICFDAIGKSGTTTQVQFTNKPIVAEVVNSKVKKVEVELKPVTITIE